MREWAWVLAFLANVRKRAAKHGPSSQDLADQDRENMATLRRQIEEGLRKDHRRYIQAVRRGEARDERWLDLTVGHVKIELEPDQWGWLLDQMSAFLQRAQRQPNRWADKLEHEDKLRSQIREVLGAEEAEGLERAYQEYARPYREMEDGQ